jgi:hypothetical protein
MWSLCTTPSQRFAAILAGCLAAACTKANVEVRGAAAGLGAGSVVSISQSEALKSSQTVSCIADALSEQATVLKVISAKEFRETVFGGAAIQTEGQIFAERLMALKNEPRQNQNLLRLGLRYMILVDQPETEQRFGAFDCEGGYGGFICGATWDRNSKIHTRILDLHEGAQIGSATAYVSGKRVLLLPIPIYIPSATEGEACKAVAGALYRQLTGRRAVQ